MLCSPRTSRSSLRSTATLADSSAHVSAHESQEPARARLQRRRYDHHAVRHGRDERARSAAPCEDVIDRLPQLGAQRRLLQAGDPQQIDRSQTVHRQTRRRHAGIQRLALGRDRGKSRSTSTEGDNVLVSSRTDSYSVCTHVRAIPIRRPTCKQQGPRKLPPTGEHGDDLRSNMACGRLYIFRAEQRIL